MWGAADMIIVYPRHFHFFLNCFFQLPVDLFLDLVLYFIYLIICLTHYLHDLLSLTIGLRDNPEWIGHGQSRTRWLRHFFHLINRCENVLTKDWVSAYRIFEEALSPTSGMDASLVVVIFELFGVLYQITVEKHVSHYHASDWGVQIVSGVASLVLWLLIQDLERTGLLIIRGARSEILHYCRIKLYPAFFNERELDRGNHVIFKVFILIRIRVAFWLTVQPLSQGNRIKSENFSRWCVFIENENETSLFVKLDEFSCFIHHFKVIHEFKKILILFRTPFSDYTSNTQPFKSCFRPKLGRFVLRAFQNLPDLVLHEKEKASEGRIRIG